MPLTCMVSYQSQDRASAKRLRDELALRGMVVIFDQTTFHTGHRVEDEMRRGVETCDAFVALITPHYLYLDRPEGSARPAVEQELKPAMHRRRAAQAEARAQGLRPDNVRPFVVPVLRGLGPVHTDAVEKVRQVTGETIGGLWLPGVDQDKKVLPQRDAAAVANRVLETLLPKDEGPADRTTEVVVVTRGAGEPAQDITIDAIELLGGSPNRPGTRADWKRYLAGLIDVQRVLRKHGNARDLHVRARTHLSGAIALGRVFHKNAGWRLSLEGRQGDTVAVDTVSDPGLRENCETEDLTSNWILVALDIVRRDACKMANQIVQEASTAPRVRLELVNVLEGNLPPETVSRLASAAANSIQRVEQEHNPAHIHLVCAAPAEFGVLLGHQLNKTHADIHLYERDGDKYVPSLVIPRNI